MAETTQNTGDYVANTGSPQMVLIRVATRFWAGLRRFTRQMQYARMVETLCQMHPEQLRAIGITRADIPRYAAQLVDVEFELPERSTASAGATGLTVLPPRNR